MTIGHWYPYGEGPYGEGLYGGYTVEVPPYERPPVVAPLPSLSTPQDALDARRTTPRGTVYINTVMTPYLSFSVSFAAGRTATGRLVLPLPRPSWVVGNAEVVMLVAAIFTIHVPIGLLQPRWFTTGHIATIVEQPLLVALELTVGEPVSRHRFERIQTADGPIDVIARAVAEEEVVCRIGTRPWVPQAVRDMLSEEVPSIGRIARSLAMTLSLLSFPAQAQDTTPSAGKEVADEDRLLARPVHDARIDTHPGPSAAIFVVRHSGFDSDFAEGAIPVVQVIVVGAFKVSRDQQVDVDPGGSGLHRVRDQLVDDQPAGDRTADRQPDPFGVDRGHDVALGTALAMAGAAAPSGRPPRLAEVVADRQGPLGYELRRAADGAVDAEALRPVRDRMIPIAWSMTGRVANAACNWSVRVSRMSCTVWFRLRALMAFSFCFTTSVL